jgi:glycosyltransferase involved in cell wall biosynthesis
MVITEALAHGIPVIACDVGGVSEALGGGGLLVAGHDLGPALREWLTDASLRERLRRAARARRNELPTWAATVDAVASMLR